MRQRDVMSRFLHSVSPFYQPRLGVLQRIAMMRGIHGSQLVLCDDGELYVIKEGPNLINPNLLANEVLGNCLLQGLGIHTPSCRLIAGQNYDGHDDSGRTPNPMRLIAPGLHLGSKCAGGKRKAVYDYLPYRATDFDEHEAVGVLLFDLWCNNLEARQYLYVIDNVTKRREILYIDNSHVCGGPNWSFGVGRSGNPFTHPDMIPPLTTQHVKSWLPHFRREIPDLLDVLLNDLPPEWYQGDVKILDDTLKVRLQALEELVETERRRQTTISISEGLWGREFVKNLSPKM